MFVAITITEYNPHPDFCVVHIHESTHETFSFSFNMEYLFEWVNDEDRIMFLQDVFSKKIEVSWDIYRADVVWDLVDFNGILMTMRNLWNQETRMHKKQP